MLSPKESIGFKKCVLSAFDNKEFVKEWERLRGMPICNTTSMRKFVRDVREIIWDRLPVETKLNLCNQ